jgi:SNF2 family DNA or RNA helicase
MISRQAISNFLHKKLNSFLWMKKLKLEDYKEEYKHYRVKPYFKKESWLHQHTMFHIAHCVPYFCFFYDMGTGKTKGLLDIITQVQREKKLKRALVTANGQMTVGSWSTAIETYSDLHPILVTDTDIEAKWEKLIAPKGDICVIDYPGLHLALSKKVKGKKKNSLVMDTAKVEQLQKIYNFYNGDESHKVKNKDTLRFTLLDKLTEHMDYRYLMTGTPMGRNAEDVWGQFFICDRGETFGDSLEGLFRHSFFTDKPHAWKGVEYVFDMKKEKLFYDFMQNRSIRYTEDECGDIPKCQEIPLYVEFSTEQREHYLRAVEGLINAGGKFADIDNSYHKMRQIVAGFIHWIDEHGEHTIRLDDNPKRDLLEEFLDASGGAKVIISHEYQESGQIITDKLKELGIDYEHVWGKSKDDIKAVERFKTQPNKKVFVMQSEVGGTGTDGLQDVARYLFFYESPTSPITRRQVIKRISRSGQLKRTFVYDAITKNSIDIRVLEFIQQGRDIHEALVEGRSKSTSLLLFR